MTTHPEVPQGTAREEARDAIERALFGVMMRRGRGEMVSDQEESIVILRALLSPRTVPCATCGGEGYELVESTLPTADIAKACPDGSVTLGPLAVLVGELHEVDYQTWVETPFHEGPSVYRLPSSKEPHA